jgi:hypothetical protein
MAVILPIITEFDGKGITRAIKQFQALETNSQKAQFAISKAALPATAALLGLATAAGLSLKAAVDDEAAQSALARQLKVSTGATDATVKSVERYIDQLGKSVAITDTEARPAFALLATATQDVTKSQDLLNIAIDTAAATGKPLAQVTEAIAKAYAGNTKGLKQLSPELFDIIKKGGSAADAFKLLKENFGGAGELAANTTAGQLKVLKIQLDETKESIGKALIPVFELLLPLIKNLGQFAQDNTGFIVGFGVAVGALAVAIVAAKVALAAQKAVAAITIGVNLALAASFTAVQIATGIGIVTVLAGVAAFVLYNKKMESAREEAKKLAGQTDELSVANNHTKAAIEGQEVALKTIAPVVDKHISASKNLTTAKDKETEASKKKAEATKKEQDSIEAYLTAYNGYSTSIKDTLTGFVSLADAQKTGTDPESGMTIGAAFQKQIADAKAFGENLKTMLKMGLSQAGLGQLLNLGPAAGLKVTDNMILGVGGFGVNELNAGLQSLSDVGGSLGGTAAGAFMGKGAGTNVNITVNAGVGDPVAIGKSVVDALNAYKARTGTFGFVNA